ncbi:MAG: hypothetical protein IPN61_18795 [Bacteroidetes bacterium]|nr:hypothetical protein [Bacteroidota bacterium]
MKKIGIASKETENEINYQIDLLNKGEITPDEYNQRKLLIIENVEFKKAISNLIENQDEINRKLFQHFVLTEESEPCLLLKMEKEIQLKE